MRYVMCTLIGLWGASCPTTTHAGDSVPSVDYRDGFWFVDGIPTESAVTEDSARMPLPLVLGGTS
jgi:hypothetical protein